MAEASLDKIFGLPNLPPRTFDRVVLVGNHVHEGVRNKRDGDKAQFAVQVGADSFNLALEHGLSREKCGAEARPLECVAQLKQRLLGRIIAAAIANITCGAAHGNGTDLIYRAEDALRIAVGGKEAAIAAGRACRAAFNECNSRAADGVRIAIAE
eukprot:6179534-Pleurochrysis_carterae.AAC.2